MLYETPAATLKKIAQTALLVAFLAIIFYLGVKAIADRWVDHGAQYWLALVLLVPLQMLLIRYVYEALKQGEIALRFQTFSRKESPGNYWFTVGWTVLTLLLMLALDCYAIWNLI